MRDAPPNLPQLSKGEIATLQYEFTCADSATKGRINRALNRGEVLTDPDDLRTQIALLGKARWWRIWARWVFLVLAVLQVGRVALDPTDVPAWIAFVGMMGVAAFTHREGAGRNALERKLGLTKEYFR